MIEDRFLQQWALLRNAIVCAWLRHRGIVIGTNVKIASHVVLALHGGSITIGDKTTVHRGAQLLAAGGRITIGSNCSVNPGCIFYGHGGLTVGNDVRIAAGVVIVPANHIFADASVPIRCQGESRRGVIIGDDVWIGAGAIILDGVVIGKGCVVGAGAVVTKSTSPNGVYVGNPAHLQRFRGVR
jgi:acetyltransferase-like isoleucine patch superfamily enzyme